MTIISSSSGAKSHYPTVQLWDNGVAKIILPAEGGPPASAAKPAKSSESRLPAGRQGLNGLTDSTDFFFANYANSQPFKGFARITILSTKNPLL